MSITIAASEAVIPAENRADGTGIADFTGDVPRERESIYGSTGSEARDEKRELYRQKSVQSETYWLTLFKDFIFGKNFLLLANATQRVHGTAEDRTF